MKGFVTIVLIFAVFVVSHARIVKGSVVSGNEKLSGVLVTDGVRFTRTDKQGQFRMNISGDAEFVYVITPSGYSGDWSDGSPKFYLKAEGENNFTFNLKKTGDVSSSYNIIAVGDPQPDR